MDNAACSAAIKTIEAQLEVLKSSMGLSMETGEDESYHDNDVPATKQVGRGRKRKTVPTIEEDED